MAMGYQIKIQQLHKDDTIVAGSENESLLESMIRQNIPCRSDCGGRGTCGKCKVQVIQGDLNITVQDQKVFSQEELERGYRLSCKAYPTKDITIKRITEDETGMEVVTESLSSPSIPTLSSAEEGYAIAIDLGTTTLAISLVDRKDRSIVTTYTATNPQRVYGADVISRIMASNEGKKEQLQAVINEVLVEGILSVITQAGIEASRIMKIAIAGNTTMGHLFMGYSCETLGVFPFSPVNIATTEVTLKDILTDAFKEKLRSTDDFERIAILQEVPLILLPGISTFIGGDILAGLSFCGFHTMKNPCLLIDLGTNGEMALGNQERILVTSTAAGPAFEGVNIKNGIGSVPGAISGISIQEKEVFITTIGNKPPVGICGTGVIEIASELLKVGLMDETGLLIEEYFEEGFPICLKTKEKGLEDNNAEQSQNPGNKVVFTQKDIRELQLAKAAIRAGVEILIKNYGITQEQIDKVYLAGGFGFKLNIDKAIHIGLLPEEFRDRIIVVGNSSLAGAITYLTELDTEERMEQILSVSEEIHLSNEDDFYELYLNYMSF
jgi:uncharacterized 2Fe-2S/4Fe-4S cluster protein (DUF4445 family)